MRTAHAGALTGAGLIVQSPWESVATPDPEREYLALLTFLPLKRYRGIITLMRRNRGVAAQLRETPGLVGFTFRAKFLGHRFWTLSVWEDEQALMTFVGKSPHVDTMSALGPYTAKTAFTRWRVKGAGIPLAWERALTRAASPEAQTASDRPGA
jgi:heme-degrading monooxygenase HmoA